MKRYKLTLCYDGTRYHGWQVQKNARTIQETVQDALEKVFSLRPDLTGCSRTDAGVHANMFCAHLDLSTGMPAEKIPPALNTHLPYDIAATGCSEADKDFHARYSAKEKQYVYKIYNAAYRSPFHRNYAVHLKHPLDAQRMDYLAKVYLGKQDFKSFQASGTKIEDTVRTVTASKVWREGEMVYFTVRADGFLYNMVRIMIGSLIEAEKQESEADILREIIRKKDRRYAGPTAPAHGLYLDRIYY